MFIMDLPQGLRIKSESLIINLKREGLVEAHRVGLCLNQE